MGILLAVKIKNFKGFREAEKFDLSKGTYLIGPNNAGKTAILQAINCFFNSDAYSSEYLNRSELTRRQAGFNRSEITLSFDLGLVTARTRFERMRDKYGAVLELTKLFTWREQSENVAITYSLAGSALEYESLDVDIKHLLDSVTISYIHPQEGAELLKRAQEKFKKRLFHNWGRHSSVSDRLATVQQGWDDLRSTANTYLSRALSDRIREIWPNSEVKIDLPGRIEDIVAISDMSFRTAQNMPEVSLTSHGTGAQSTILFQTHFILDSDRSLHQGMYFPIWLLEEPESFLHADIAFQVGRLLASPEWQSNIQMLISTHSPIILAGSKQDASDKRWTLLEKYESKLDLTVDEVTDEHVSRIGRLMGDTNFDAYFNGAAQQTLIFLEDSRQVTTAAFERAGIQISKRLAGITEVKKYINVYLGVHEAINGSAYFIVDGDRGLKEIDSILSVGTLTKQQSDWKKYKLAQGVFVLVLPVNFAAEDLFTEWQDVLSETVDDLLDDNLSVKAAIPTRLSRVVDPLRRSPILDRNDAIQRIRSLQDVKDRFWERANRESWNIAPDHVAVMKAFIQETD